VIELFWSNLDMIDIYGYKLENGNSNSLAAEGDEEMFADNYADLQDRISSLIDELHDPDGLKRQKARHMLIAIGWEAVPALMDVIKNEEGRARWEAIEAVGRIGDPAAAPALVEALHDDDMDIRWAASNALIEMDRAAIKPILEALTKELDSIWLREGAHHILHVFKDQGRLLPKEYKVFEALEGAEPEVEVPWAAEAALQDLYSGRKRS
jgi:HEAT repeat protein